MVSIRTRGPPPDQPCLRLLAVLLMTLSTQAAFFKGTAVSPFLSGAENAVVDSLQAIAPQQLGQFEPLQKLLEIDDEDTDSSVTSSVSLKDRQVQLLDWTDMDPVPFQTGWDIQKTILQRQLERIRSSDSSDGEVVSQFFGGGGRDHDGDTVIMLQHKPVYTLGTASSQEYILQRNEEQSTASAPSSVEIVRMDRGGEVTYHGPGQLVVYPILDLKGGYKQDVHWYMRAMEEAVLRALELAGVQGAERLEDITGVWVQNAKVAALGIKCRRWVTQHGLAVNVEESCLENFEGIVPCGLEGRKVACLNQFLSQPLTVGEFAPYMKTALEEIFQIRLVESKVSLSDF